MSNLLLEVTGNRALNRTIFEPRLFIYDDLLIYRKRQWIRVNEITVAYAQISTVKLVKGPFFGHLEILTTSPTGLNLKFISKKKGELAKKIIDQKIFHAYAKHKPDETRPKSTYGSFEKSLDRLRELVRKGKLSKKDYARRKNRLLRDIS